MFFGFSSAFCNPKRYVSGVTRAWPGEKVEKPQKIWAKRRIFEPKGWIYGVYQGVEINTLKPEDGPSQAEKILKEENPNEKPETGP